MKIQVTSDNHVEFLRNKQKFARKLPVNADILIVAGDLGTISCVRGALTALCDNFKHVLFVAGNHEFYGSSFPQVRAILREYEEKHPNFHYLDRDVIEIDGQRFVGCTMWFPMTPQAETLTNQLNDFYQISNFRMEVGSENEMDRKFLEREVRKGDVVITHHAPSEQSAPDRYKGDPLNCFYITNMERFICGVEPKLWIHGHMHNSSDYMIHKTRIICNPGGYIHEPNHQYGPKVIEL